MAEHRFSDEEVRRHYEHILTSTDLYPAELHQAVRAVLADGVTDYNWTEKGREICGLFTAYGDREFQGEVLYRTKLRGEDGISFCFDDGYTYFPWPSLANLLDALIETSVYPDITAEEEPDPIGDYNIPAEVEEMGGAPQREIGQADYDYVLGAVAYEAGETAEEPVRPQAVFTEIKGIPKADEIDSFVPEPVAGGQQVIVAGDQVNLIPPAEESPSPHESRGNTTAHKNFRRFQKLFPEIVSGQYESLHLEAGDAYDPLVIHHKYGDHYCMEHYYTQNGDRMYDPYMDFQIDTEAGTLRAFSYENSGIGVYQEADPTDPAQEKKIAGFGQFFATWLNNIASQGYEPVRATMLVNDEEVDVELRPASESAQAAEAEEPEQLSLLASPPERSTEELLIERVLQKGPLTEGKKEQIYHFALTHPTGSAF
ncbi:MAG: helicase, partial [Faecalibacterium prausnitzii]|nr:helicase [Faecalibacterium prausnitzii]